MDTHKSHPSMLIKTIAIAILTGLLLSLAATTQAQGIDWEDLSLPIPEGWLNGMHFVDENTGWIVGSQGSGETNQPVIFHTADGGETWTEQDSGMISGMLSNVFFTGAQTGYVVGQDFDTGYPLILRTTDGGKTWSKATMPDVHGTLDGITFTAEGVGWSSGIEFDNFQSLLLRTDDGVNWTVQPHPAVAEGNISDVTFSTPATGFAVGRTYPTSADDTSQAFALQTTDGGDTWTEMALPVGEGELTDIVFADSNTGWIVGGADKAFILKTTDGGQSWTATESPPGTLATSAFFTSPTEGFVAVNQQEGDTWTGTLYQTTDGGKTWTAALSAAPGEALFRTQTTPSGVTYVVGVDKKNGRPGGRKGKPKIQPTAVPTETPTPQPTQDPGGGGGPPDNDDVGPLASIKVIPEDKQLSKGKTQQYTAVGYDHDKKKVPLRGVTWTASGGTIDANGRFTATEEGTFIITATAKGTEITGVTTVFVGSAGGFPLWAIVPIALAFFTLIGFVVWYLIWGRHRHVPLWLIVVAVLLIAVLLAAGALWIILPFWFR